ncbi:unnamed protein product [Lactuca virosa]|uniref:Uncharacterized protein n=1 Tax=Lactuca virosa TaxID=75947 RepID=A0AAU9MKP4_9ASTR|nr:unnamed protein product [Lactuca virosa]
MVLSMTSYYHYWDGSAAEGHHSTTATPSSKPLNPKSCSTGECQIRASCHHQYLKNYSSILTVHPEIIEGRSGTLVIESFVVDIPDGNTKDDTCYFV